MSGSDGKIKTPLTRKIANGLYNNREKYGADSSSSIIINSIDGLENKVFTYKELKEIEHHLLKKILCKGYSAGDTDFEIFKNFYNEIKQEISKKISGSKEFSNVSANEIFHGILDDIVKLGLHSISHEYNAVENHKIALKRYISDSKTKTYSILSSAFVLAKQSNGNILQSSIYEIISSSPKPIKGRKRKSTSTFTFSDNMLSKRSRSDDAYDREAKQAKLNMFCDFEEDKKAGYKTENLEK